MIDIPAWPQTTPRSTTWTVTVNGRPVPVLKTLRGDLALWTGDEPATVACTCSNPITLPTLSPRRLGLSVALSGRTATLTLLGVTRLLLEAEGQPLLFLCATPPPKTAPAGARIIKAGTEVHLDRIELQEGEALWIERGAVLHALIRAHGSGIRIGGGGILSGAGLPHNRLVVLDHCPEARIDDLVIIDPTTWTVVVGDSDGTSLSQLTILTPGSGCTTDGIDLVGSSGVHVSHCLVASGDDAVAIKALPLLVDNEPKHAWVRSVKDIVVEDCIFGTYGGHCMEIGHELAVASVTDVVFRRCDVLFAHQFSVPFSIHVADRAAVSRVTWEEISIDHCYYRLIDFRVIKSRYSHDQERGTISDIVMRRIQWWTTNANAGYTTSCIGGYDEQHRVSRIRFEDIRIDNRRVTSLDELDLFTRHTDDMVVI